MNSNTSTHQSEQDGCKPFPFIRLPKELRLQILREVCGQGPIKPQRVFDPNKMQEKIVIGTVEGNASPEAICSLAKLNGGRRYMHDSDWELIDSIPRPNYAIFQVNKQIRQEALTAGWNGPVKHFQELRTFKYVPSTPDHKFV